MFYCIILVHKRGCVKLCMINDLNCYTLRCWSSIPNRGETYFESPVSLVPTDNTNTPWPTLYFPIHRISAWLFQWIMILFVISLKVTIGWYLLHENVRGLIDLIGVLIRQTRNRSTTLPDKCCQLEDQHVRMWGEDWAPCIVAKQANSPIFLTHRPIPIYRYYISTDPYFIPMEGYS